MIWFNRLSENRHIEGVILTDNQGQVLHTSRPISSDGEYIASMLQVAEVLAQTLAEEFKCGAAEMVHISTEKSHLLLFPLAKSAYYLLVIVERSAPLMLLMVELERVLAEIDPAELAALNPMILPTEEDDSLDAAELIEAVREWLRNRPTEE